MTNKQQVISLKNKIQSKIVMNKLQIGINWMIVMKRKTNVMFNKQFVGSMDHSIYDKRFIMRYIRIICFKQAIHSA